MPCVFLLQLENQVVDLAGTDGIETRGGLVEQQDLGIQCQRARQPTRFCMPPEISEGIFFRAPSMPTSASKRLTRSARSDFGHLIMVLEREMPHFVQR
jgi:hypothetical protein